MSDDLQVEMDRDATALGAPVQVVREIFFEDLLYRHAEPQRRYHTSSHLHALADLLNEHAPHVEPGSPPRLAIWWYDAIYDPQATNNEVRSADLARAHLSRLGAAPSIIDETVRIILMTKNHWSGDSAGDGDYFLDADIAILGAPPRPTTGTHSRFARSMRGRLSRLSVPGAPHSWPGQSRDPDCSVLMFSRRPTQHKHARTCSAN